MFREIIRQCLTCACAVAVLAANVNPLCAQNTAVDNASVSIQTTTKSDYAERIKIVAGEARQIVFSEPFTAALIINPELATAVVKSDKSITLTGVKRGETLLIISGATTRRTLVIEVTGQLEPQLITTGGNRSRSEAAGVSSGIYNLSFSPAFDGAPALLRQTFDQQWKLGSNRTLRASGDFSKFFSGSDDGRSALARSFGVNRFSLGVSTAQGTLNLLDSDINVSRLSLSGYTMRGLHLMSAKESVLRGAEIFAGTARPSPFSFNAAGGRIFGLLMPVAGGESWRARAGATSVHPGRSEIHAGGDDGRGVGIVWQADGRYASDGNTTAEGEIAYAKSGVSWRGRLDLRRGAFNLYGEALHLDRNSPFIRIGAHQDGRKALLLSLQWRPAERFTASASYNRSHLLPLQNTRRPELRTESFVFAASYRASLESRIGFRFVESKVESGRSMTARLFETRSASVNYTKSFGRSWTNQIEARFTSSSETNSGAEIDRGLVLREELRRKWQNWTATAFMSYTRNAPSFASLIVRNPTLLPPLLRRAFEEDPARFLDANGASLSSLLFGITLPETRDTNAGLRLQGTLSRFTLLGETRFSAGELTGRNRRELYTTFGVGMRLDAANSLQFAGSRIFAFGATGGRSAITVSYTHRFGGADRSGFQFAKLFGLGRGHVTGRVFFDSNSNGLEDAGESGVPEINVQLDADHSTTTDAQGRYRFDADAGDYNVTLISDQLGARLRGSTNTEQRVSISPRQTVSLNFGLTNFGSIAGRIFNDLQMSGDQTASNVAGVSGVRLNLHAGDADESGAHVATQSADLSGAYRFSNLMPGVYTLVIDPMTLPANYNSPTQTSWQIRIEPLQNVSQNMALAAQRAVAGIVFIDKDADGRFDPQTDEALVGAQVTAGGTGALSGAGGSYILRNLPAGKMEIRARAASGVVSNAVNIELSAEPNTLRNINLAVAR